MKTFMLLLLAIPTALQATIIKGRVTDEKKQPLAYATIYVKNTSIGATTNNDGMYSISVSPGEYEIEFHYIGFKKFSKQISVGESTIELNVSLQPQSVELNEVTVDANEEDPAYNIIRQAQKKRKYYLTQVPAYSCNTYMKMSNTLDKSPFHRTTDSTRSHIVYLTESESQLNVSLPNKKKEIVYSSKVSGAPNAFTWNSVSDYPNFYENLITLDEIAPRGLVSPIAESAFTFYKYHLLETFYENGLLINKIQVNAKRSSDPVFNGTICIVENLWCIHSLDLIVTKEAHLEIADRIQFVENTKPVDDGVWMPATLSIFFHYSFLACMGHSICCISFSEYNVHPDFPLGFFNNEVLKVNSDANKKDSCYWEEHRPIQATASEQSEYARADSVEKEWQSKEHLDSLDKHGNRFSVSDILTGYSYKNHFNHLYYKWKTPFTGINYNTVEGFNLTLHTSLTKYHKEERDREESLKWWNGETDFRYGFSNHLFTAKGAFTYYIKQGHQLQLATGIFPTQVNEDDPINEYVNSLYTLIARENFMKLYEKKFVSLNYKRTWAEGLDLKTTLSYSDRLPLENSTAYSLDWVGRNSFTPNNCFNNPQVDSFMHTQAITFDVLAHITICNQYISRSDERIYTGSKFPTFHIHYRRGIKFLNSDVNFNLAEVGMSHSFDFGLVGKADFDFTAGTFFSYSPSNIIDFKHFQGNQTLFGSHYTSGFQLLPYYSYSTNQSWLEVHYQHHFGEFLLNKIPLIKKLNLQEVVAANALWTGDIRYIELDLGIEHVFNFLRFDFVTAYGNKGKLNAGFLLGLTIPADF